MELIASQKVWNVSIDLMQFRERTHAAKLFLNEDSAFRWAKQYIAKASSKTFGWKENLLLPPEGEEVSPLDFYPHDSIEGRLTTLTNKDGNGVMFIYIHETNVYQ